MEETLKRKELRHDRHTVSLLSNHMVFTPKYKGKMLVGDVAMICGDIICKTCVGDGWEVVSKYIETQDLHHAKNAMYRHRLKYGVYVT